MRRSIFPVLLLASAAPAGIAGAQELSFDELRPAVENAKAAVPAPAPADENSPPAAAPSAEGREWLVLVFINGRNDLARAAVKDVNEMEMVGSTDKMAVTVELGLLRDRGVSSRFIVQKDTGPRAADKLGPIISPAVKVPGADMGSWRHFADFARWSYGKYPAKKVLAVLWGHGSGRVDIGGADNSGAELGIAYDDLTRNFIRNRQVAAALKEIASAIGKKVTVYASDACLMQMASVSYEIKDYAEFIAGSEENVPTDGFPYDTILAALAANPQASGEELSRIMADKFWEYYKSTSENATFSAVRASEMEGFVELLNGWVKAAAVPAHREKVLKAENEALSFEKGYNGNDTSNRARSKDLADFADLAGLKADRASELYAAGEALKNFITGRLIVVNRVSALNPKYYLATGLGIYFPKLIYDAGYDENLLSRDSLWDDFLKWKLDPAYKIR